jgi:microcin C transport system permease protein
MRERLHKFGKNRRAFYSLILLLGLFLISLPAELLFNDKPILLSVEGTLHYPALVDYSLKDLGGESTLPITDYRSGEVRDWLDGRVTRPPLIDIFGDEEEEGELVEEATVPLEVKPKEHWFLWAPFRHSYESRNAQPKSGYENLVAPWRYLREGRMVEGSWEDGHYLGTDKNGKDVLARLVYGFRISMLFGAGIAATAILVGVLIGALQGFFGGLVDLLGQRVTEIWSSIPQLYLLIILSAFLADRRDLSEWEHYLLLFGIINLTAWMGMAVYTRAEFLKSRNLDYVRSARALGVSNLTIMWRHILPNSLTPVITFLPFQVTGGILALVSLDFLNLGVKYPAPSLGELLAQGQAQLHAIWILVPTFIVLTVSLTLLTFVGDGLRDAFDPRKS